MVKNGNGEFLLLSFPYTVFVPFISNISLFDKIRINVGVFV